MIRFINMTIPIIFQNMFTWLSDALLGGIFFFGVERFENDWKIPIKSITEWNNCEENFLVKLLDLLYYKDFMNLFHFMSTNLFTISVLIFDKNGNLFESFD